MGSPSTNGAVVPRVEWSKAVLNETSPVGLDGYVEYLEVKQNVEVIATFQSDQPILSGRPAATRNRTGNGTVIKLGFWPKDDSFVNLMQTLLRDAGNFS